MLYLNVIIHQISITLILLRPMMIERVENVCCTGNPIFLIICQSGGSVQYIPD